jgi:Uma2 family endonuclease
MSISTFTTNPLIPPLENGDRLTRDEFERRYQAMPNVKKAELVEGIVYMASPLRITNHGSPHSSLVGWLFLYKAATPGVQLGDNCTIRLDVNNELQPDALLRLETGGRSTVNDDGYVEGAPELIAEVAASSASIDTHAKLDVYRRHRVREYIIWRFDDREIDWFELKGDRYVPIEANADGIFCSQVFPGLWLDKAALIAGDLAKVIAIAQQGCASEAHENFVQKRQ